MRHTTSRLLGGASGTVAYAVGQWSILILAARIGSVEVLGQYALALAIAAPVFMLANLRLRFVLASDQRRTAFVDFLALRLSLTAVAAALTVAIGWLAAPGPAEFLILVAVVAFKSVEAVADIGLGLLQAEERMSLLGLSLWLASGVLVATFGATLLTTGSLVLACLAMAAGRLFLLCAYEVPRWREIEALRRAASPAGQGSAERSGVRRSVVVGATALFRRSWPLGGAAVLDSLNTNIPRYFVSAVSGNAGLGAFTAMVTVAQGVFLVVSSVVQLQLPRLSGVAASNPGGFAASLARVAAFAVLVGVAGILLAWAAGERLLSMVFGPEVVPDQVTFVAIMTAGLLAALALVLTYGLTAMGDYRVQVLGYLGCTVATTGLCVLAIHPSPLTAVSLAMTGGQLVHVIIAIAAMAFFLGRRRPHA